MQIQVIRDIAKSHGIKTARMSKESLIRQIQRSEGNFDCFATAANGECDQTGCMWRADCFEMAKKKRLSS
jgi:hypothetical protein